MSWHWHIRKWYGVIDLGTLLWASCPSHPPSACWCSCSMHVISYNVCIKTFIPNIYPEREDRENLIIKASPRKPLTMHYTLDPLLWIVCLWLLWHYTHNPLPLSYLWYWRILFCFSFSTHWEKSASHWAFSLTELVRRMRESVPSHDTRIPR